MLYDLTGVRWLKPLVSHPCHLTLWNRIHPGIETQNGAEIYTKKEMGKVETSKLANRRARLVRVYICFNL